jgi:hypothetical protein
VQSGSKPTPSSLISRRAVQVDRGQRGQQRAGLGEAAAGDVLDGGQPPAGTGRVLRQLGGAGLRVHHDAGEALGKGVVDLAGHPLTLGQDPAGVLGGGPELHCEAAQLAVAKATATRGVPLNSQTWEKAANISTDIVGCTAHARLVTDTATVRYATPLRPPRT